MSWDNKVFQGLEIGGSVLGITPSYWWSNHWSDGTSDLKSFKVSPTSLSTSVLMSVIVSYSSEANPYYVINNDTIALYCWATVNGSGFDCHFRMLDKTETISNWTDHKLYCKFTQSLSSNKIFYLFGIQTNNSSLVNFDGIGYILFLGDNAKIGKGVDWGVDDYLSYEWNNVSETSSSWGGTNMINDLMNIGDTVKIGGKDSTSGGGGGVCIDDTHKITLPNIQSLTSMTGAFFDTYKLTTSQLASIKDKLWDSDFIDNVIKNWTSPLENILACNMIPLSSTSVATSNVTIGNYDTEVSASALTSDYIYLNCGTVDLEEFWGNFLDYAPNTKLQVYLPFIGTVSLNTDEFMGDYVKVDYLCNLVTGMAKCFVSNNKNGVLYTFDCTISQSIPTSGTNYINAYAQIINSSISLASNIGAGNVGGSVSSALNMISAKPEYQRATSLNGSSGQLGVLTPYLIITRPIQQKPENYEQYWGRTSYITETLSSLSGYTEVDEIYLAGVVATDTEKEELLRILKEGIYIVPSN